jgi:hypothetical protein
MAKLRVEVHLPQFKGKNKSCVKYTWCTEVIVSTQFESSRYEFSAQGSTIKISFYGRERVEFVVVVRGDARNG